MIYLDNNATTQMDPQVLQAMILELRGDPANPSSPHSYGKKARMNLEKGREEVASFFKVLPREVIFTSGGTESINLFLHGIEKKGPIVSTRIEHSCIYKTLQTLDVPKVFVPVNKWGAPLPEEIEKAIGKKTTALVFSASNSETGVKIDLEAISKIAEKHHVPLLIDAVAYLGKEEFHVYPGITAIAISGHKIHGPKGVGALICKCKLTPQITGGPQERLLRAGTENLSGILGLAESLKILRKEQRTISKKISDLRLHFETELKKIEGVSINGEGPKISNTSNISFQGVSAETLLIQLDIHGIYASHGSACASGSLEPSRVLTEMGLPPDVVRSSVRFSFSRQNQQSEVDRAIDVISLIVKNLREI